MLLALSALAPSQLLHSSHLGMYCYSLPNSHIVLCKLLHRAAVNFTQSPQSIFYSSHTEQLQLMLKEVKYRTSSRALLLLKGVNLSLLTLG